MRTRPADAADENETAGQEGYSETFHTFTSMNKELERYIEREIIPRYENFDAAHRTDHVRTVIAQSLELAAHYDADADMVYTVAAYHDTGLANGRERHHIDAGRILAADTELRRWFSEEQIAVMRDAVEDHRASSDGEPRTIYGRIVAEADRVIDPETIIRRTVQYGLAHCPELDREDDENGETVARPPLHAVAEIADRLQKLPQFQGIRFATLTGRDKDDVKTQVMADFAGGETPILVSTTVIEVGVDVKQASCIVIFDADRYGLSQLHQLRGRVGRGGTNSWAFLISRAEPGSPAEQRLEVIHHSLDGAEIAQADLEFRGAGDVLGDAQSGGKSSLKLLRVVKDADMIADARTRAGQLLAADPELAGEVQLAGAVLDFTRGNETFLTSS